MKTKKRSLRGRIAPLAIAGTTLISGFMPLISNAGVWAAPSDQSLELIEGLLFTLEHVDMNTMLDIDATSDGGFIAAGPFYQHNVDFIEGDRGGIDFAIGSSLVKYNANSEAEWTKKVSEFYIGNDPELDRMVYGDDVASEASFPIIKNGDQSLIFMPGGEEELEFICIEKNEFISALQNEREPQTTTCPDISVGLVYAIKQAADGGYVGLSGGFSSLTEFIEPAMNMDSPIGLFYGLDSSLVKFDANGNKVWSTVASGETVANALEQAYKNQGLIASSDEAFIPSMTFLKDLVPTNDGGYITSGVAVSIYGDGAMMHRDDDAPYNDTYGDPVAIEERSEPKFIYSGVLEKFNSEGHLVDVKTYANKVFTSSQIESILSRNPSGRSRDLIDWRLIDDHFYCQYDYESHYDDPNYIEVYDDYYTVCREDDYIYVRLRGDIHHSQWDYTPASESDDPLRTDELLDYARRMYAFGAMTIPTQTTPTSDGGVVISGSELNIGIDFDDLLSGEIIKFDSSLNQQWTYKVTGENRRYSAFKDVVETADGGFVAVGFATKIMPISTYVVKVDANGNKVWDKLWLDDEAGAISSAAIGVTELTTGQIVVIGANFEDIDLNNLIALGAAAGLNDLEYIRENLGADSIIDFGGYILVLDGITGEKALSQSTPKVNSKITRISNGKLVIVNMNIAGSDPGAPIQLIGDATIVDFSDVLPNNGGNNGDDDYSDITVPNTGVSNEIAQVPLILGAITMAAPFILKMMSRARKHGKATSFNK